jgi:hypothetical protein
MELITMNEINWVTEVGVPALVAIITTLIGFGTLLPKWFEARYKHRFDELLEDKRRLNAAQLEMLKMFPEGLNNIQDLIMTPAVTIRDRLRDIHQGVAEFATIVDEVNEADQKLRMALETSRHLFVVFGVPLEAHAIKKTMANVNIDLKAGKFKLEKDDPGLGQAVEKLTKVINTMQDSMNKWSPLSSK